MIFLNQLDNNGIIKSIFIFSISSLIRVDSTDGINEIDTIRKQLKNTNMRNILLILSPPLNA
jgi:hypothetical protein